MGFLMAFGLVGVVIYLIAKFLKGKPKSGPYRRPTTFGAAKWADLASLDAMKLTRPTGIPLGWAMPFNDQGIPIPYQPPPPPAPPPSPNTPPGPRIRYADDRHMITIAPTRSGKGTSAIIPTLIEHMASAVVIDPKGQNAAITARGRRDNGGHAVYLLNPFKLHEAAFLAAGFETACHPFNPLAAIDPADDGFVADVSSLCEALIVTEGNDPHWSNSARDLVSAILMYLIATPGETATLGRMRELLTLPSGAAAKEGEPPAKGGFLDFMGTVAACDCIPAAQRAARFVSSGREVQGVVSAAVTQTSFLDDPAIAASLDGDSFRFADLKRHGVTVFLILPSRYLAAYARWLRLMVVSALNALTSAPERGPQPVLFLLDEFASLGHLSAVETAMGLAAGYGVQLWPILQDVHQAKHIYGDRWETFLANAGALQMFAPNDLTTAEFLSKRCGQKTITVRNDSISEISKEQSQRGFSGISKSFHEVGVPLMEAYTAFGLGSAREIIFIAGLSDPILGHRQPYYAIPDYAGRYDPDPYHSAAVPAPPVTIAAPAPAMAA